MDTYDTVSKHEEIDKEHANEHNSFVKQQMEKISQLATSKKAPQILSNYVA